MSRLKFSCIKFFPQNALLAWMFLKNEWELSNKTESLIRPSRTCHLQLNWWLQQRGQILDLRLVLPKVTLSAQFTAYSFLLPEFCQISNRLGQRSSYLPAPRAKRNLCPIPYHFLLDYVINHAVRTARHFRGQIPQPAVKPLPATSAFTVTFHALTHRWLPSAGSLRPSSNCWDQLPMQALCGREFSRIHFAPKERILRPW